MKTKFHRLLALLLALTMVLSMMPGVSLNVLADETEEPAPQPENVEPAPQAEPEHDFDWEHAEWVWAEDYTAQLVAKCTTEGCEETSPVDAVVTEEINSATCTENGSAVYTASVTLEGEEEPRTDSKTVALPAPGHSFVEGVCSVCEYPCDHPDKDINEDGICTVCGVLVSDEIMPLDVEPDANYLTFTAEEAGSTLKFRWETADSVQYRQGNGEWTDYTMSDTITLVNDGDKVQFRGENVSNYSSSTWWSGGPMFVMTGKIAASGSVTSLRDGVGLNNDVRMTGHCFAQMFQNCDALTTAPELPALNLSYYNLNGHTYREMFAGCTSLKIAPALPATTLSHSCYQSMFEGCTSLTTAPELSVTSLPQSCYHSMFKGCTSLVNVPNELPAGKCDGKVMKDGIEVDNIVGGTAQSCYENMFYGCTALVKAPNLPAVNIADGACGNMFAYCSSLTMAPNISAKNVGYNAMHDMFYKCTSLATAPDLSSIQTVNQYSLRSMFNGCSNLTTGPSKLVIDRLYYYSCAEMFSGCTSLTTAPDITVGQMGGYSCQSMFNGCKSLVTAPALNCDNLADSCYMRMFAYCTALKNPPALNAPNMASGCYNRMFEGCTSLIDAPKLESENLANECYAHMFEGCTALVNAPELPATELKNSCYAFMFNGCRALSSVVEICAQKMAPYSCQNMFASCTSLTRIGKLDAKELAPHCFDGMFNSCSNLKDISKLAFSSELMKNADGVVAAGAVSNMFVHTSVDQIALKNINELNDTVKSAMIGITTIYGGGTLYLQNTLIENNTEADIRAAFGSDATRWKIKPLTLGTDDDWHCWVEPWSKNDTHHWHQCEIRTCELTANNDIAHMGDYAEHDFRPAWDWVRQNNEAWQAYCTLKCACGYCSDVLTAAVETDTTKDYITYTAKVTFGGQEITSTKTEERDYNVYYNSFHGKYKYATSIALFYNEADTKTNYEWYANGKLMATGNKYYFAVIEDVNVISKKVEEVKPVLNLTVNDRYATNPGATDGKQSVKLDLQWSIPKESGFTFVSAGFMRAYSTAGTTLNNFSQLTTNNPTKLTTLNGSYGCTINMSAATALKTLNVVGYLTYKDANGVEQTMYTNIAHSVH